MLGHHTSSCIPQETQHAWLLWSHTAPACDSAIHSNSVTISMGKSHADHETARRWAWSGRGEMDGHGQCWWKPHWHCIRCLLLLHHSIIVIIPIEGCISSYDKRLSFLKHWLSSTWYSSCLWWQIGSTSVGICCVVALTAQSMYICALYIVSTNTWVL